MSWFSKGFDEAEKMAQPRVNRTMRNFWTKPDETAVIRFLTPSKESFNIKRAYIPGAKGSKYFTSPMVEPDPFVQRGYNLQATFVWKILDHRTIKFTDRSGEEREAKPTSKYFAVGQRDRKALIAFESQMLEDYNEQLKEDEKAAVSLDEYNITSYDIKVTKPKGGAWQFLAVRGGKPKELSADAHKIISETDFDLTEELKPLDLNTINTVLNGVSSPTTNNTETAEYSYDPEEQAEEPTFFSS